MKHLRLTPEAFDRLQARYGVRGAEIGRGSEKPPEGRKSSPSQPNQANGVIRKVTGAHLKDGVCQGCGVAYQYNPLSCKGIVCSLRCWGKLLATTRSRSIHSRAKSGVRADLGIYVRSSWEANWARYLNWLKDAGQIKGWDYEKDTFEFRQIKRGTRFYTPDFKVTENNGTIVYHEVKGWMDPKSRTKLRRMKRYYPEVKILLIDRKVYRPIASQFGRGLPHWEHKEPWVLVRKKLLGTEHPQAKLNDDIVRAIRAATGKQRDIAAQYGTNQSVVSQIKRGRAWGHVPDEVAT